MSVTWKPVLSSTRARWLGAMRNRSLFLSHPVCGTSSEQPKWLNSQEPLSQVPHARSVVSAQRRGCHSPLPVAMPEPRDWNPLSV